MVKFHIKNNEIIINEEISLYNDIRKKYQSFAEDAAKIFSDEYSKNFKSMDDIHGKCTQIVMQLLNPAVNEAIRDLIIQGIYDVNFSEFESYFVPYYTWDDDFAKIDDRYLEIVMQAEELEAYRVARRENRDKWVGGGFGLGGAIKGAMQAGALNMASGAAHGLFNMAARGLSAIDDKIRKSDIFNNESTKLHLVNSVYNLVFNTHFAFIDALNDKKPESVKGEISDVDSAKARRLYENVSVGRVPTDLSGKVLLEAFLLNPYDEAFYRCWYKIYGDSSGELELLENYFGVYVSKKIKRDLIASKRLTLDLSTPEACERGIVCLSEYAAEIGYNDEIVDLEDIRAIAKKLDETRRTVNGVIYKSLGEAQAAKDELMRIEKEKTAEKSEKRNEVVSIEKNYSPRSIGFLLGLGIFVLPLISSFFTLRQGYSLRTRIYSFLWAFVFGFFLSLNLHARYNEYKAGRQYRENLTESVELYEKINLAPDVGSVFLDLYGIKVDSSDKLGLPSGESAELWYSTELLIDNRKFFVAIVARTDPKRDFHAAGAVLDVVSYLEESGRWEINMISRGLFEAGSWGNLAPLSDTEKTKVQKINLKSGLVGLFLPSSFYNNGQGESFLTIVGVGEKEVSVLGSVMIGGGGGDCDSKPEDVIVPCFDWEGVVQVLPSENGFPGKIIVIKKGTAPDFKGVKMAQNTTYIYTANGYEELKE